MTEPLKTVPLTVYLRNGHLVDPEEGGEKVVIGVADVVGGSAYLTLNSEIPVEVRDAVFGERATSYFSIGLGPVGESVGFILPKKRRNDIGQD